MRLLRQAAAAAAAAGAGEQLVRGDADGGGLANAAPALGEHGACAATSTPCRRAMHSFINVTPFGVFFCLFCCLLLQGVGCGAAATRGRRRQNDTTPYSPSTLQTGALATVQSSARAPGGVDGLRGGARGGEWRRRVAAAVAGEFGAGLCGIGL